MEPLFEHRMEFAGYETRVLELEGRGEPIVLLHGRSDSADTWRCVLAQLGKQERRAIATEPGAGAQRHPFFFGGQDRGLDGAVAMRQLDQPGVAGIGDIGNL